MADKYPDGKAFAPPMLAERPELTDREFDKFRALIYEHSGINLSPQKKDLLRARLGKRMRRLGVATFAEYLKILGEDASGREIVHLIDAVSTNVTYFFREAAHFEFLKRQVLPALVNGCRSGKIKRVRFWSAGCSTGEEPYSLVMTIEPFLGPDRLWDFKLLATDISTRALAQAKSGVYPLNSVKGLTPHQLSAYFDRVGDTVVVKPELRRLITFARVNLQQSYPFSGPFDVIFCRNVMIYFDQATQQRLVNRFWDYLKPGGYLFIGHSENLSMIRHRFQYVCPAVYRK